MLKSLFNKLSRPLGLADALVALCLVTLTLQVFPDFARDPGVGWHLKSGEYIWLNGSVPKIDPFLASAVPRAWVSDQWLSDLILFLSFKAGGWPALYLFIISAIGVTYFVVLYSAVARISGYKLLSAAAMVVAFKLGQVHFILRPVPLSFFFFSIVIIWLYDVLRNARSGRCIISNKSIAAITLTFLVWANIHPSFIMGLVMMALLLIAGELDLFLLRNNWVLVDGLRRKLLLALLLCLLATFVNPYMGDLHQSILSLGQSEYFMNLHEEWHSPDFKEFVGNLVKLSLACIALALWLDRERKLGWGAFELISLALLFNMSFNAVRIFPFLGIAMAVPLTEALALVLNTLSARMQTLQSLSPYLSRLEMREGRTNMGRLVIVLLGVWLWYGVIYQGQIGFFKGPWGPPSERFPYGATAYLLEAQKQSNSGDFVVVATPDWGGFITFLGEGKVNAIIDDRNTLIGEAFHRSYMENVRTLGEWKSFLKSVKATHLMLSTKDSSFEQYLEKSRELPMVFKDNVAAVFKYE